MAKSNEMNSYYSLDKKVKRTPSQSAIARSEILNEIWAADKTLHDGNWYVKLSDVCAILGEADAASE